MATTLYHGTHRPEHWAPHVGLCLTDSVDSARAYAGSRGAVYAVALPEGVSVLRSEVGYDRETNECVWDDTDALLATGADVVRYEDEDEFGRQHTCWRIASAAAVAAVRTERLAP